MKVWSAQQKLCVHYNAILDYSNLRHEQVVMDVVLGACQAVKGVKPTR